MDHPCANSLVQLSAHQVFVIVVATLATLVIVYMAGRDDGARQQLFRDGDDQ